jgi:hypothetical protein
MNPWGKHIESLLQQTGLPYRFVGHFMEARLIIAGDTGRPRCICIPRFDDPNFGQLSYATALHELGHFHDPDRIQPGCEVRAWKWAKANALTWTPVMDKFCLTCLKSYGVTNPEV